VTPPPRPITILTHYYPPSPAVGGLRAMKVAQAFRQAGHQVSVITACLPDEPPGLRLTEPGIIVQAVQPLRNPRDWYGEKRRKAPPGPTSRSKPNDPAPETYTMPGTVPFWKRFIFSLLWLPDAKQGFIIPAIRAAAPTLQDDRAVIITTAPPFSVHLAGLWLSWRRKRTWVAEFRDPWTDNPWKPWHVRTAISDAAERRLERLVLARASLVVAVSAGIERIFTPKMASRADRLLLIRNGIERLVSPGRNPPAGRPLKILHLGSFYHGRDPRLFLRALANVLARRGLGGADIRVDLVGSARWYNGLSIEKEVAGLQLSDVVHFEDWVPHAEAQRMVEAADVLLLLAQNQPNQVPNKLYEYLGTRRPILAFADVNGESARLLAEAGLGDLIVGDSIEQAEAALELIFGGAVAAQLNESKLAEWTTEAQMRKLVTSVERT
jgi:glycosyltransferase involved in cell wall biosynthesis